MKQTLRSLAGGIMLLGIMLTAEAAAASTAAGKPVRDSAAPAVGEAVTVYTEGEAGYAGFRIPVIIRTVDGTLIAFAEARRHDKRDSGDIDLVMRRSEDDGHTWGPITTVWDDGSNTCGNPAPAILSDGRIVMLATWNRGCDRERQIENHTSVDTRRVFVLRSEDHGRTWSHPEEITSEVKAPEWTWYATGPCHAIVKRRTPHKGQQQGVVLVSQPRGGQSRARNNIVRHGLFGRLGKAAKRPHKAPQRQQHQGGVDVVAVYAQRELRPAGGQPQHRQKHKPARGVGAKKRLHGGQQHQAGRGVQKLAAHKEVHMQHI